MRAPPPAQGARKCSLCGARNATPYCAPREDEDPVRFGAQTAENGLLSKRRWQPLTPESVRPRRTSMTRLGACRGSRREPTRTRAGRDVSAPRVPGAWRAPPRAVVLELVPSDGARADRPAHAVHRGRPPAARAVPPAEVAARRLLLHGNRLGAPRKDLLAGRRVRGPDARGRGIPRGVRRARPRERNPPGASRRPVSASTRVEERIFRLDARRA